MSKVNKQQHSYVISKRTPTQLSSQIKPVISEEHDSCFVACGNVVQVYSLTTGNLINSLRSKRNLTDKADTKLKGDVHRASLVALSLLDNKLVSMCSKGVLAEWDPATGDLLNFEQVQGIAKTKIAEITNQHIVCYQREKGVIRVFDRVSKNGIAEIQQLAVPWSVKAIVVQERTLAYIQGRTVVVHDFSNKQAKSKVIQRDAKLTSVALNQSGTILAVGDEYGKLYLLHNFNSEKQLIVQTLHWHAHQINTLAFMPGSPYLLSGGEEAVLVQWHLETQGKTFISRVGSPILNMSLSQTRGSVFSLLMKGNALKVVRFDNNKTLINVRHLSIREDQCQAVCNEGNFISAVGSDLQFYDLTQSHRHVQTLAVKPKNYASSTFSSAKELPEAKIRSFCVTPDQKSIATFEELADCNDQNKDIRVQALKFWHREEVSEDLSSLKLVQFVHDPCNQYKKGMILEALDNTTIVSANGGDIQVWKAFQGKWTLGAQISYQGLQVIQMIGSVRLRLESITRKGSPHPKCLAILHKEGLVTFWDQDTWEFKHMMKLNSDCKKMVFETSSRFLAALSSAGSVEVWSLKDKAEVHQWDLNFHSVTDILNNSEKENQFAVVMQTEDKADCPSNSILLFQYSRPQNVVMYWKLQVPIKKVFFINTDPSFLLVINRNQEMQRIYCGVTRDQLKTVASKRRLSLEFQQRDQIKEVEKSREADYQFISQKQPRRLSEVREREAQVTQQEAQIMRLDKADRFFEASEFTSMPSLGFCLEQFASEMLTKPSQATSLVDLQLELNMDVLQRLSLGAEQNAEMEGGEAISSSLLYQKLEEEMSKSFQQMLK